MTHTALKFIPHLLTLINFICGVLSIFLVFKGRGLIAAYLILSGMVFDLLDGYLARRFQVASRIGSQFDSVADVLTFGIAPVVYIYCVFLHYFQGYRILALWFYMTCGLLRLMRCRSCPKSENGLFTGLPVPASAGCIMTFILAFLYSDWNPILSWLPYLILLNGALMISTVPYPHIRRLFETWPLALKVSLFFLMGLCLFLGAFFLSLFVLFFSYSVLGFLIVFRPKADLSGTV